MWIPRRRREKLEKMQAAAHERLDQAEQDLAVTKARKRRVEELACRSEQLAQKNHLAYIVAEGLGLIERKALGLCGR